MQQIRDPAHDLKHHAYGLVQKLQCGAKLPMLCLVFQSRIYKPLQDFENVRHLRGVGLEVLGVFLERFGGVDDGQVDFRVGIVIIFVVDDGQEVVFILFEKFDVDTDLLFEEIQG